MRLRRSAAAGLVLAAALTMPGTAASAAPSCAGLPKHSNLPVVDTARAMDPQRMGYLTADLMRFAMESDVTVVAATVPHLGGDAVSSYARRLFDCWGVGSSDSDRGVLILAAMQERRVRVEVGRGLARDVVRAEMERAVAAMAGPMRAGNVAGAFRAAAVEIAAAVGKTLPDVEQFVRTNGAAGLGDLGIPANLLPGATGPGVDGRFPADSRPDGGAPKVENPFRTSPIGDGTWIPKAVLVLIAGGVVWTFARAAFRGGTRLANAGQSVWRGGFPSFGGGNRGWGDPALLQSGRWSSPGTWSSGGSTGGSGHSGGSSASSGGSSGSSGGATFGGGSAGGGGARGSW